MFTTTITIEGRLAGAPTVLEDLTEFVVITNRRGHDDTGEWTNTDTTRYVVKSFRTLATKAADQLAKGDKVLVAGSIVTDVWTEPVSGQNRHTQAVLADAIATSL